MALIHRLIQELTKDELLEGESQVFVGHEFRGKDLRAKVKRSLQELSLHAYFADKHPSGVYTLDRICKKIVVARASIFDLSHESPEVYFQLGVSIGLNKPVFVVLKKGAVVPTLLDSFVKLRFSTYVGLKNDLVEQLPSWLTYSVDHHMLYGHHCQFVDVLCPDRQRMSPKRTCLVIDEVVTQEDGQPRYGIDADFKAELLAAFSPFQFTPVFMDDLQVDDTFRLCTHCRQLRDCTFAIGHLTYHTSPNAYLLLGLATGLGLPVLLVAKQERDAQGQPFIAVPELLRGLDRTSYEHLVDLSNTFEDELEDFIREHQRRPTRPKMLLLPDPMRRQVLEDDTSQSEAMVHADVTDGSAGYLDREAMLAQIKEYMEQGAEIATVLAEITQLAVSMHTADLCVIHLVDPTTEEVEAYISSDPDFVPPLPRQDTLIGRIMTSQSMYMVEDLRPDSNSTPITQTHEARSFVGVPLIAKQQVHGVMSITFLEPHHFTLDEISLLQSLADLAATAIHEGNLVNQLPSGTQDLQVSQSATERDGLPNVEETSSLERHILVVEDNVEWQSILTSSIEQSVTQLGYTPVVRVAGNSEDARRIFKSLPHCELVTTGIQLSYHRGPGDKSGIDFARWVKERSPDTPIVVVAGGAGLRDMVTLLREIGVLDVLQKGEFILDDLERLVADTLGRPLQQTPRAAPRPAIPPTWFVNREYELNAILEAVESGHSVAIVGESGMGKTSLLREVQRRLEALGHHCIGVSFQRVWSEQEFYDLLGRSLMRAGVTALGNASESSIAGIEAALIEHGKKSRIVLLMDNFELAPVRSQPSSSGRFLEWLQSLADRGLIPMVISLRTPVDEWTTPEFGLQSSNSFRVIELGPFDLASTIELLNSFGDVSLDEEQISELLATAGGKPGFLSRLGMSLQEKEQSSGAIGLKG